MPSADNDDDDDFDESRLTSRTPGSNIWLDYSCSGDLKLQVQHRHTKHQSLVVLEVSEHGEIECKGKDRNTILDGSHSIISDGFMHLAKI